MVLISKLFPARLVFSCQKSRRHLPISDSLGLIKMAFCSWMTFGNFKKDHYRVFEAHKQPLLLDGHG